MRATYGSIALEDSSSSGRHDCAPGISGRHAESPCGAMQIQPSTFQRDALKKVSQSSRDIWPSPCWDGRPPPWIRGLLGMSAVPVMTCEWSGLEKSDDGRSRTCASLA